MRTITILSLHHTIPNKTSVTTLFFKNLLPVLRTKVNVHIVWVVYTPEKLSLSEYNNENTTVLDIHDYHNALEILQEIKPDIVNADPFPNFMLYAFSSACKFLNIPVFGVFDQIITGTMSKKTLYESYFKHFFQTSVPTDNNNSKKRFMRGGLFILYKYTFLLRTQRAINVKSLKMIKEFFMFLKIFLNLNKYPLNPYFASTIHFIDSEKLIQPLSEAGFDRVTLLATGNPMYDYFFKINQSNHSIKKNEKINVLLVTSGMYEHGIWTKNQRDETVKKIVTEILKHGENFSLIIKIHPSTEKLDEYKSIIEPINKSIIIKQEGNILEFLENADVILAYTSQSALTYALLARKPIIICNFYEPRREDFIDKGLALECTEPTLLIQHIHKILCDNPITTDKIDGFIKEFNVDGLAAERVSNAILKQLNI